MVKMKLDFQRITSNWLKSTLKCLEYDYISYFGPEISSIFSIDIKKLKDIRVYFENKKFPNRIMRNVARTQEIDRSSFLIELNDLKMEKISFTSNDIRKYIMAVIIGHELIHIIQFHLKLIGSKDEASFSKTWIPFLREVKAYKYSQIIAARHYTIRQGLPVDQALKVFSPIFNFYHEIL